MVFREGRGTLGHAHSAPLPSRLAPPVEKLVLGHCAITRHGIGAIERRGRVISPKMSTKHSSKVIPKKVNKKAKIVLGTGGALSTARHSGSNVRPLGVLNPLGDFLNAPLLVISLPIPIPISPTVL